MSRLGFGLDSPRSKLVHKFLFHISDLAALVGRGPAPRPSRPGSQMTLFTGAAEGRHIGQPTSAVHQVPRATVSRGGQSRPREGHPPTAQEGIVHRLSMLSEPWTSQSGRWPSDRTVRLSCLQLAQTGPPLLLKKIHVQVAAAVLHPSLADLHAQGPDQPQAAASVREDPNDFLPSLDLLVPPLKHVIRVGPNQ